MLLFRFCCCFYFPGVIFLIQVQVRGNILTDIWHSVWPLATNASCGLEWNNIISTLVLKGSINQCNLCQLVHQLTAESACLRSNHSHTPIEELVTLHCVKAHTDEIFILNLNISDDAMMANFDKQRAFGFLIHGFTDFYPGKFLRINGTEWMQHLIIKWARNSINACAVNWGTISNESFNYFLVSQVSTVRVANYLTRLLMRFERSGVDLKKVKLAGHSLGAQISGKVGAKLRKHGKVLGYIYGLDPAGPCFTFPCSAHLDARLDETDALYVQCIHTNIGLLGQSPRCGCHDFYLNRGVMQPGSIEPIYAHFFACEIFDWSLDADNKCYSTIGEQLIGIHNINRKCGELQMITEAKAPFCSRQSGENEAERIFKEKRIRE